jgi:hypothetical protein
MTTPELVELVFDQGGLLWIDVNWRTLRTSHATWVVQAGADPKSVQGQMRHSRISTTMEIYAQIIPLAQRRALERLNSSPHLLRHGPIHGPLRPKLRLF